MKHLKIYFILSLISFTSCQSQEKKEMLLLTYKAQTRGFIYELKLEDNLLTINKNSAIKKTILNNSQTEYIYNSINTLKLDQIKSNSSIDDLAADKAIEGTLFIAFEENEYHFKLNHHKLPEEIQKLFNELENINK